MVLSVGESPNLAAYPVRGPRVYFLKQGAALVVLLAGGDKSSQADDITRARNLARILKEQT